jgi:hypothetical protein
VCECTLKTSRHWEVLFTAESFTWDSLWSGTSIRKYLEFQLTARSTWARTFWETMNHPLVGWSSDTADRWTPRQTAQGCGRLELREPAQFWTPTRPRSFTVVCPADRWILNTTAEYSNVVTNMGTLEQHNVHYSTVWLKKKSFYVQFDACSTCRHSSIM